MQQARGGGRVVTDPAVQLRRAESIARTGAIAPAVRAAHGARAAGAKSARANALLAHLMISAACYEEAVEFASAAIEADSACAPAYLCLGAAYDLRGAMYDRSVLVWDELTEVLPNSAIGYVQLGEAFAAVSLDDEAVAAWRRALEVDRFESRAMYGLAVVALKRDGPSAALPLLRSGGELDGGQQAFFRRLCGGLEPSLARFALDENADNAEALAVAAYGYVAKDAVSEAIACALRAMAISAQTPAAVFALGLACAKRPALVSTTTTVFEALSRAVPAHPLPHALLAESLIGLRRYAGAAAAYRVALERDAACVRARFGLAAMLLAEARHSEASWQLRQATRIDLASRGVFWRLYDAYAEGRA